MCRSSADVRVDKSEQNYRVFIGNEESGIDPSTVRVGEQQRIVRNIIDGPVLFSCVRPGGGEDLVGAHDPQLDEDALERWSRDA